MQYYNQAAVQSWLSQPLRGGKLGELVPWQFHHYRRAAAGAQTGPFEYFNVAPGQTDGAVVLTKEDTNMFKAGSVGSPNRFLALGLGAVILPTANATPQGALENIANATPTTSIVNDITSLLARGVTSFVTLQKEYVSISPLAALPASFGATGAVAVSRSKSDNDNALIANTLSNGNPILGNLYRIEVPLDEDVQFSVSLSFPIVAVTTNNALRIGYALKGLLRRPEV